MALNALKCNHLTPLGLKGLNYITDLYKHYSARECQKIFLKWWVRPVWRWTLWQTHFWQTIRKRVGLKGLIRVKTSMIFVLIYLLVLVLVLVFELFFSFSFVLVLQYFFVLVLLLSVICLSVSLILRSRRNIKPADEDVLMIRLNTVHR